MKIRIVKSATPDRYDVEEYVDGFPSDYWDRIVGPVRLTVARGFLAGMVARSVVRGSPWNVGEVVEEREV